MYGGEEERDGQADRCLPRAHHQIRQSHIRLANEINYESVDRRKRLNYSGVGIKLKLTIGIKATGFLYILLNTRKRNGEYTISVFLHPCAPLIH